jgi:hypothetical protein
MGEVLNNGDSKERREQGSLRPRAAATDPAVELFVCARAYIRALSAGASVARLFATGLVIASCFVCPYPGQALSAP